MQKLAPSFFQEKLYLKIQNSKIEKFLLIVWIQYMLHKLLSFALPGSKKLLNEKCWMKWKQYDDLLMINVNNRNGRHKTFMAGNDSNIRYGASKSFPP